jgi:hypothetical protein
LISDFEQLAIQPKFCRMVFYQRGGAVFAAALTAQTLTPPQVTTCGFFVWRPPAQIKD